MLVYQRVPFDIHNKTGLHGWQWTVHVQLMPKSKDHFPNLRLGRGNHGNWIRGIIPFYGLQIQVNVKYYNLPRFIMIHLKDSVIVS